MTPSLTDAPASTLIARWLPRLLLAALFAFGSEVLLWLEPQQRPLMDWLYLIPGYIALATITLDLAARYCVRNVYDVMLLTAIYGLSAGFLLHPETSLIDFPRTLATRVLGGHTFIGFEIFGLFLVLTGGASLRYRRILLGGAFVIGFAWGIWVRWSPELTDRMAELASLETMFGVAAIFLLIIAALFLLTSRFSRTVTPPDFVLSPLEIAGVSIILILIFLVRAAEDAIVVTALLPGAGLILLCGGIIWSRESETQHTLLDSHFPPVPLAWSWSLIALFIFSLTAAFVYNRPLVEIAGFNQLSLVEYVFAGLGFSWLPFVAAIISTRAVDRQYRKLNN
ncbi:MAG: hypothetical protein RLP44_31585 [Aggregatilineales bacterium]